MDSRDVIALAILFIVAFSLWTLPFQDDSRPFGEGDSAWHFSIGDYISSSDKPIYKLPFYVGLWYFGYNEVLGPFAPEYPPSNHYNYALMQVAGGERVIPVLMYRAIASFLGIFAVYFLMRKLFGFAAAVIASSGLVFSVREIFIYLWGQQPTLISVVIVPVTLYAFYRYLDSFYSQQHRPLYIYVTAFLLGSQFLLHIQGFIVSVFALAVFAVLMAVKHRKLPFGSNNLKHAASAALILAVISIPFALIYFGAAQQTGAGSFNPARLLSWNVPYNAVSGSYPEAFVSFSEEYSIFLLPLLLLGIVISIIRRSSRDLLLLSWLASVYLALHADVFLGTSVERSARMLISEPPVFFSFIALGSVSIASFLKVKSKAIINYGIAASVVLLIVFTSASGVSSVLSGSYQNVFRVTPAQIEFSGWLMQNTPENSYFYYVPYANDFKLGQWQYPKMRWMLALSQRHIAVYTGEPVNLPVEISAQYFIFDYSDIALFASQQNSLQALASQRLQAMQQFESAAFSNSTPVYNQNSIRVYKLEAENFR